MTRNTQSRLDLRRKQFRWSSLLVFLCVLAGPLWGAGDTPKQAKPAANAADVRPGPPVEPEPAVSFLTYPWVRWTLHAAIAVVLLGLILKLWRDLSELRSDFESQADHPKTPRVSKREVEQILEARLEPLAAELSSRLDSVRGELHKRAQELQGESRRIAGEHQETSKKLGEQLQLRAQELAAAVRRVERLEQKNIEEYFEQWKAAHLAAVSKGAVQATWEEFQGREDLIKELEKCRGIQQALLDRGRAWAEALQGWSAELEAPGHASTNGEFLKSFRSSFVLYFSQTLNLMSRLTESVARFDLSKVSLPAPSDIGFADVVSGKSADTLANAYRRRLEERCRQLTQETPRLEAEWEQIKKQLLEFLDRFYSQYDERAKSGEAAALTSLERLLRSSLEKAQVREIPVELNYTEYDSTVHEQLVGAALTRPELPENTVVQVNRRGYFYDGKVLRPALVTLSTKGKR